MIPEAVIVEGKKNPKPKNLSFQYGTAGFRGKADTLHSVMFRMGCLAALRSRSYNGKAIGVMVTASHNPEEDNGVKLVDPTGEMLDPTWEPFATMIANSEESELQQSLQEIEKQQNITGETAIVISGMDTRSSSENFISLVHSGVRCMGGTVLELGYVTTPQLHFAVSQYNRNSKWNEEYYYEAFCGAFQVGKCQPLIIDGSNGIGGRKAQLIANRVRDVLDIHVINLDGKLNFQVGADFVKTQQKTPNGVDLLHDRGKKFASLDGDGDRVIYHYLDEQGAFHMLDGDKIATLCAAFIKEQLDRTGISLSIGVVQTAYANGASTKYLSEVLKVPVVCTLTGVKHLHHEAKKFDIGVYFEANGHGTVLFSQHAVEELNRCEKNGRDIELLRRLPQLVNQCVGDALSDILLVETILAHKQWDLKQWDALYSDLPNVLRAQKVADRKIFKATDAERKLLEPVGLQAKIDRAVSSYHNARSFVRPSGTEDVVRIYAEAGTPEEAKKLADEVCALVIEASKVETIKG